MTNFEVSELLRTIRNEIGQLDVCSNEGYRVRARALTVLFNAEAAVQKRANEKITKSLPCRWCRATTGHNVGCHAYGE